MFQFRVRFPAALQKSLGGDAMRGMVIKIFLGFLASKCRTAFSGENRSKAFEMVVTVWASFWGFFDVHEVRFLDHPKDAVIVSKR